MGRSKHRASRLALAPLALAVLSSVSIAPSSAWADPPPALPASAPDGDTKRQPTMDFDTDGCYSTPAIGPDGTLNPGLQKGGDVNGNCRDQSDLRNTNVYSRAKCNNGWCAYMYGYYFEKDQASLGPGSDGHTHDWEHVIVWVQDDHAKFVSVSQHKGYETKPESDVQFEDGHAKVVYHKDGGSTHAFRFAKPNGGDEPPENHDGVWQHGSLVGWNNYPTGIRDELAAADFGAATFKLTDERFSDALAQAKPSEVSLDPNA
jgi:hypothetical protein